MLLIALLRTLWRLSYQDMHDWLVAWPALALACGLPLNRNGRPRWSAVAAGWFATNNHFDGAQFVTGIRQHDDGCAIFPSLAEYAGQTVFSSSEAPHMIAFFFQDEPVEVAKVIVNQASHFAHEFSEAVATWFGPFHVSG